MNQAGTFITSMPGANLFLEHKYIEDEAGDVMMIALSVCLSVCQVSI